jgi:Dockerin type I domain
VPSDSITEGGVDDFRIQTLTCEAAACPWDVDSSGSVDVTDFLALLAAWGPNPGNPADFNGDNVVDVTDFLALLANWGGCP